MSMCYRDRNGSPVSGANAFISYKYGQLDYNSTQNFERDNGMWEDKSREIIKPEFPRIKPEFPIIKNHFSSLDFDKPNSFKDKPIWQKLLDANNNF